MADLIVPNQGKLLWTELMLARREWSDQILYLRLYANDYTPFANSIFSDFTLATFDGSTPIEVSPASFGAVVIANDRAQFELLVAPSWEVESAPGQTVYGWVLWEINTEIVMGAQRFDEPQSLDPGGVLTLDPFTMQLGQLIL